MEKHDFAWHKMDIAEEFTEYQQANGFIEKWSELSDIVYTYTRAKWSGHADLYFPLSCTYFFIGTLYMFPKYTLRWLFFLTIGKLLKSKNIIREVRNPKKMEKLDKIAEKYGLEKEMFRTISQKLLKYWILLK